MLLVDADVIRNRHHRNSAWPRRPFCSSTSPHPPPPFSGACPFLLDACSPPLLPPLFFLLFLLLSCLPPARCLASGCSLTVDGGARCVVSLIDRPEPQARSPRSRVASRSKPPSAYATPAPAAASGASRRHHGLWSLFWLSIARYFWNSIVCLCVSCYRAADPCRP